MLERRIADQAEELSKIAGSHPALAKMADGLQARTREHRRALEAARERVDAVTPPLADLRFARALLPFIRR